METVIGVLKAIWSGVIWFGRSPLSAVILGALVGVLVKMLTKVFKEASRLSRIYDINLTFAFYLAMHDVDFARVRGISAEAGRTSTHNEVEGEFFYFIEEPADDILYWGIPEEGDKFVRLLDGTDLDNGLTRDFWLKTYKKFDRQEIDNFREFIRSETTKNLKERATKK